MSYSSTTKSGVEAKRPYSNIGVKKQTPDERIVQFISGIEKEATEIDGAKFDAATAFFTARDYDQQSAETLAYILMKQAKNDNVDVFKVLDTLRPATPLEMSQLVSEILNAYRYKTSVLGYKNDRNANTQISRNIRA